jgi:N6-adenosine-specific RNA methylase IME4
MLARPEPALNPFGALALGCWAAIAADPGTEFVPYSDKGITDRSPQAKYTTMPDDEIAALPVHTLAARDSHLFYWDTTARIAAGRHIPIMRAWGFEPTAFAFTWVKTRKYENPELCMFADSFVMNGGFTTRKNTEVCILGRRGNPKRLRKDVRELIFAPRREHSRKPDEFYERVQQYCAGPYLELFSRTDRPNWTSWGDQAGKFNAPAAVVDPLAIPEFLRRTPEGSQTVAARVHCTATGPDNGAALVRTA